MDNDAHEDRAQAQPQVGDRRKCSHRLASGGSRTINHVDNQRRVEEGMSDPPDDSNENEQRQSSGKDEDGRRNNKSDQARQKDALPAVEIQYLGTQGTTQDEHQGDGAKDRAGIGHPLIDRIEREKSDEGSPDEEEKETIDRRGNSLPTEKQTVLDGGICRWNDLPCPQLISDQQRTKR